jgi:hypothetical protein
MPYLMAVFPGASHGIGLREEYTGFSCPPLGTCQVTSEKWVDAAFDSPSPRPTILSAERLGGDNVILCDPSVEFSRPSRIRAFFSRRTRHSQTSSASSRVNLFARHGGAILILTSSSPSCRSSLITQMFSSRSCSTVRTRSSTGSYGLRYWLWVVCATGGRCRGSPRSPSACSIVLAEEAGQSVESGLPSRNSKNVSWSQLRRSTLSRVGMKWRLSPGRHGRAGWVALRFGLFRVHERFLKMRLSDLALRPRRFHGPIGVSRRPKARVPS